MQNNYKTVIYDRIKRLKALISNNEPKKEGTDIFKTRIKVEQGKSYDILP